MSNTLVLAERNAAQAAELAHAFQMREKVEGPRLTGRQRWDNRCPDARRFGAGHRFPCLRIDQLEEDGAHVRSQVQ
jgi:hypothetical protein